MEGRREEWERVTERRRKGGGREGSKEMWKEGGERERGGRKGERWEKGREVGGRTEEEDKSGLGMRLRQPTVIPHLVCVEW